jgi:hypothetical protein
LEQAQALSDKELNYTLQLLIKGEAIDPIDYCNDLNALQAAEGMVLMPELWVEYGELLASYMTPTELGDKILDIIFDDYEEMTKEMSLSIAVAGSIIFSTLTLPARQRAEALLCVC